MAEIREMVGVRLKPDDKYLLHRKAHEAGLEPAIAARQILELALRRMERGTDYIDTLQIIKNALKLTDLRPQR